MKDEKEKDERSEPELTQEERITKGVLEALKPIMEARKGEEVDLGAEVDKEDRSVEEMSTKEAVTKNSIRLFGGMLSGNQQKIAEAQRNLALGGQYGEKFKAEARAAGDYYSTLVDADGAYLLPTLVRDQIDAKLGRYGVARQVADVFTSNGNPIKVNGSSGSLKANAIAEGGSITSSMRQFSSVTLNPKKWALIVPWTFEVQEEAGQKILEDVTNAIAVGMRNAEDDAMINGDGSGSYNSITGLFNLGSVNEYTLSSGNTGPTDIDPDDLVLARNDVDVEWRNTDQMAYIFHPDMEAVFLTRKDNNGAYVFDYVTTGGVPTLKGIPVYYTQAIDANADISAGESFGLLGNFRLWKMAVQNGMFSEVLTTGTVTDADTGSDINLATQDVRALKVKEFIDMNTNFPGGFVKFTTAAS